METITVDATTYELIADSMLSQNDWVVQVAPEHEPFFNSIKGQNKSFTLDDGQSLNGSVIKVEPHRFNQNKPQVQVQIRRAGY